ncbi:GmrSD restriction endonuclease domain-containing protein [Rubripirellula reticaptiva]|uniref:GmrSD restriction endonucleases N-terminal domain-containing protein n=1 Tax=Rubripirellula reticaptiva TaxID=2528013 RepID=A0A5C6EBY6_9BACT|nr:DUF262 domain-containing protein [Rubripirellula reticaptiva]TWU46502.1 hypothetical protein Poly59_54750 [Rubripirellula reticaptiva]
MFDSTKEDLKDILRDADAGKLQLPDFQRSYVWTDEDVRSLVASIAKGFPVGALLTLQTGSEVAFKPRLIAGVPEKDVEPSELLLDGQQRITSLYQCTFSKSAVRTTLQNKKKVQVERHYYIDIKRSINGDADLYEAIVGVPADRVLRTNFGKDVSLDVSSPELEYANDMFPLDQSFDSKDWFYGWRDYWKPQDRDVVDLEKDFYRQVLERIERYKMPIIRLDKSNSREAICLVFEKVNVGGKKLDAFELLTAVYASSKFDLREAWSGEAPKPNKKKKDLNPGIKKRLVGGDFPRRVLRPIENTDFIQSCTLLHTRELRLEKEAAGAAGKELPQISCNRQALLGLPLTAFSKHQPAVERGFIATAEFLNEQKIISERDVPYSSQVNALASLFATLGKHADTLPAKEKITRWFWAGALGELYGGGSETRMARDLHELVPWIQGNGPVPQTIGDAIFQQDRLRSLRGRMSAAYKAIHALLMRHGCRDFIHGKSVELMTFFESKMDVHHIFPRDWCVKQGIDKKVYDSIINKTPLSKKSNIIIGGVAPSVYLAKIEKRSGISSVDLDELLHSHLIEPSYLRADDFQGFFDARMTALSSLIGDAIGKTVVLDHGTNELEIEVGDDESEVEGL